MDDNNNKLTTDELLVRVQRLERIVYALVGVIHGSDEMQYNISRMLEDIDNGR